MTSRRATPTQVKKPGARRSTIATRALGARGVRSAVSARVAQRWLRRFGLASELLPSSAKVTRLRPELFVMKEGAVTTHERKIDGSGAPLQGDALQAIRTGAEKQIGALPRSKTVLYPMSGFDSGTPLHLFPDATTIIGIDNHPFLPAGHSSETVAYSKVGTHNFAYYGDVDRLGHVGPAVIGGLASAVPNFRLRSVTIIEEDGGSVEVVRSASKPGDPSSAKTKAAGHAVVEFDGGPGTPVRRYVHINGSLVAGKTKNAWWWKTIEQLRPNAVLLKGSEAVFQKETMGAELRPQVLGWLKQSRGVLIEDKDIWGGASAALSPLKWGRDASGRSAALPTHEGARSARLETRDWSFGYARGPRGEVFVTVFDQ